MYFKNGQMCKLYKVLNMNKFSICFSIRSNLLLFTTEILIQSNLLLLSLSIQLTSLYFTCFFFLLLCFLNSLSLIRFVFSFSFVCSTYISYISQCLCSFALYQYSDLQYLIFNNDDFFYYFFDLFCYFIEIMMSCSINTYFQWKMSLLLQSFVHFEKKMPSLCLATVFICILVITFTDISIAYILCDAFHYMTHKFREYFFSYSFLLRLLNREWKYSVQCWDGTIFFFVVFVLFSINFSNQEIQTIE